MSATDLESRVLAKEWFYQYTLPSGRRTKSYGEGELDAIHDTRIAMLDDELGRAFPAGLAGKTAVDLACHQGYFTMALAERGAARVTGIDARDDHVADARLIAEAKALSNVAIVQSDVHHLPYDTLGTHDLVLCFGLIYHLEDPVGALRAAKRLCQGTCIVETQVVPNLSGPVDWGSYRFVKPLKGVFGIIDETYELHGPEMSITGVCLAPSVEGLLWIMEAIGFKDVHLVKPPDGAYEQHRYGKRVMVAGRV